jgi:hypothetical protein
MTTSKDYFAGMRETTGLIHDEITSILESSVSSPFARNGTKKAMLAYWKTRADNFTSRAHIGRLLYEEFSSCDWSEIIEVLYAIELQNISAHQSNCALDKKCVAGADQNEIQHICAHITLSLSLDRLSAAFCGNNRYDSVMEVFTQSNRDIYSGQLIDMSILRLENGAIPEKSFEDCYLERCFLMGGGTYVPCVYPLYKADVCDNIRELIIEILKCYGAAAQIQNDLYNVVHGLTISKIPGDLVNGKLTYPIWIMLKKIGMSADANYLEAWMHTHHARIEIETIIEDIRQSSSLLIKRKVWPKARYLIRKLRKIRRDSDDGLNIQWLVEYFFTTKVLRKNDDWDRA